MISKGYLSLMSDDQLVLVLKNITDMFNKAHWIIINIQKIQKERSAN